MKHFIGLFAVLFLSSNAFAEGSLEIDNNPLVLVLSDHNQAHVSSCSDFISLRKTGETVKELPGLSDPDYRTAKEALFNCWLQAYTVKNGMTMIGDSAPSLTNILKHFPASAAYLVSDEDMNKVKKNYVGKSIMDISPDLKIDSDRAVSVSSSTGYILDSDISFSSSDGHKLRVIGLVGYSIGGTAAEKSFWRVDDTSAPVWKLTRLDENSPI
ncbi:MAG TPA: hypothetical protein VGI71_07250 [Scandinavium sp.]|jgi:hypothetical protein